MMKQVVADTLKKRIKQKHLVPKVRNAIKEEIVSVNRIIMAKDVQNVCIPVNGMIFTGVSVLVLKVFMMKRVISVFVLQTITEQTVSVV